MDIIHYLLQLIQYLYQQNCWLIMFICRYIPLKQWAFDDSHSPKYQKFKIDQLPLVTDFRQDWTYKELIPYYEKRYGKKIRPVNRRSECDIPEDCSCPRCDAPMPYLYRNNGSKGQVLCKVCDTRFSPAESRFSSMKLRCPDCLRHFCGALAPAPAHSPPARPGTPEISPRNGSLYWLRTCSASPLLLDGILNGVATAQSPQIKISP